MFSVKRVNYLGDRHLTPRDFDWEKSNLAPHLVHEDRFRGQRPGHPYPYLTNADYPEVVSIELYRADVLEVIG